MGQWGNEAVRQWGNEAMKSVRGSVAILVVAAGIAVRPALAAPSGVFTHGPANCHALALTFDLCPVKSGSGFDAPLVQFLIEHRIPATFFPSGRWIDSHDAQLRELIDQPFFEIGSHGEAHAHLPRLTPEGQLAEIRGPVDVLGAKYGVRATFFRPPYGEYNDVSLRMSSVAGQTMVLWSVVSGDPDPKLSAARITEEVVRRARNGSVIVFHANGRGWHSSEVVPEVYQQLVVKKGFAAKTVAELKDGCEAR